MTDDHTPSALERISAPWLVRLSRIPRWLFLIVLGSVLFAGLYLESALGGVLLLVLALFLAWLASVGWSHVSPVGRILRLLTVGVLVYVAVDKFG
ncbi:MAG TPA: DUF6703 family protein [Actinomycetes bacterium]|nr:DUF6703 family protein [Actinomycetes bacterium]